MVHKDHQQRLARLLEEKEMINCLFLLNIRLLTLWWPLAGGEWVSPVTLPAGAGAKVVDNSALSINTAQTRTRVHTLQVATSFV